MAEKIITISLSMKPQDAALLKRLRQTLTKKLQGQISQSFVFRRALIALESELSREKEKA